MRARIAALALALTLAFATPAQAQVQTGDQLVRCIIDVYGFFETRGFTLRFGESATLAAAVIVCEGWYEGER